MADYKGTVRPARMTTAQRDAIPLGANDTGICFNTTAGQYELWTGSRWTAIRPSLVSRIYSGNRDVSGNTLELGQDFTSTLVERGNALAANGANGVSVAVAGLYRISVSVTFVPIGANRQIAVGYRIGSADKLQPDTVRATEAGYTSSTTSYVQIQSLAASDVVQPIVMNLTGGNVSYTELTFTVEVA